MDDQVLVSDATAMGRVGQVLARHLQPGDLVILDGPLGAGKTTLTRGVGQGLGVRGAVTSPTFVLSRVHPPAEGTVALVHVDAFRLERLDEMEALDLEVSLQDSITLVEWGKGKVESLAQQHLLVEITPIMGGGAGQAEVATLGTDESELVDHQPRSLRLTGTLQRWPSELLQQLRQALTAATQAETA